MCCYVSLSTIDVMLLCIHYNIMAIDYSSLIYAVLQVLGNYITVDVERFSGLNIRGFNHTEVFAKILSHLPWPEVLIT